MQILYENCGTKMLKSPEPSQLTEHCKKQFNRKYFLIFCTFSDKTFLMK